MWSVTIASGFCGFPSHCNWLTRLGKLSQFAICFGNLRYIVFKESDKNTIYQTSIKRLTKNRLNLKMLFVFLFFLNRQYRHFTCQRWADKYISRRFACWHISKHLIRKLLKKKVKRLYSTSLSEYQTVFFILFQYNNIGKLKMIWQLLTLVFPTFLCKYDVFNIKHFYIYHLNICQTLVNADLLFCLSIPNIISFVFRLHAYIFMIPWSL